METNPQKDFEDEGKRICAGSRPFPPNFVIYINDVAETVRGWYTQNYSKENAIKYPDDFPDTLDDIIENLSDEKIFEKYPHWHRMGSTEEEFLESREKHIKELIEEPCRNIARLIMDFGGTTYYSNAYASHISKGVHWALPGTDVWEHTEDTKFFTSIVNGKTYTVDVKAYDNLSRKDYVTLKDSLEEVEVGGVEPNRWIEALPKSFKPKGLIP